MIHKVTAPGTSREFRTRKEAKDYFYNRTPFKKMTLYIRNGLNDPWMYAKTLKKEKQ